VDHEIIVLREIIKKEEEEKERNYGRYKIYSPVCNLAKRAKSTNSDILLH